MEVIYLLIPLSLVLVAVIIGAVVWAVKNGQFDDLDRPGFAVLDDDDTGPEDLETGGTAPGNTTGPGNR